MLGNSQNLQESGYPETASIWLDLTQGLNCPQDDETTIP
jgi:hypothetical protein